MRNNLSQVTVKLNHIILSRIHLAKSGNQTHHLSTPTITSQSIGTCSCKFIIENKISCAGTVHLKMCIS